MFGPAELVELPIVGIMLILGMTPLLILASPDLRSVRGFFPWFPELKQLPERGPSMSLLLVAAFVVGAVGNQLIDVAVPDDWSPGHRDYEALYQCWLQRHPAEGRSAPTLDHAEHALGKDEYTRLYLLRHNSITRVLRAAAVSAILLILTMAVHGLVARDAARRRYGLWHFVTATIVAIALTYAYFEEVADVRKKIFELTARTTVKAFREASGC